MRGLDVAASVNVATPLMFVIAFSSEVAPERRITFPLMRGTNVMVIVNFAG